MADWWAHHAGNGSDSHADGTSVRSTEDIVGNTVTAFRTALRRADDVESAVELQDSGAFADGEATASDALDYFGPAFRRVLGDRSGAHADVAQAGEEAHGGNTSDARAAEEAAESLSYFAPAFRRALGDPDPSSPASNSGADATREAAAHPETGSLDYFAPAFRQALGETEAAETPTAEGTSETGADAVDTPKTTVGEAPSLDYFAPAFRRALGDGGAPASTPTDERENTAETRGTVERLREAVKSASRRGLKRLSELEVTSPSRTGLDLDRLAERVFGTQSRELISMNGS